ncbi:hypothetical protein IAE57_03210 [Stenotrophomonas sp. S48]|uniref:hypothetical protein n=1 Tax=unclassified Stenotrophomonas TaxID=196198 RepID=UPI00190120B2|nr:MULTISPECIES: hypothetical protein [unclassified Stenotrophomonas]MBK0025161.1 hypothetical protein [Stenotrophomonas sp. S48]MBK0046798.1 hypothetical protein [Stenotrophomonas sp. S49]
MTARKVYAGSLPLLLALGLAALPATVAAAPDAAITTTIVEHVSHHRAGTPEAKAILDWLDRVPDANRRMMDPETLTLRQRQDGATYTARWVEGARFPLPASGAPGEQVTLTHERPGGQVETWTVQWVATEGGRWKQTHYEWHGRARAGESGPLRAR